MAAQPPPRAVLRGTTEMTLNERFTTLLKNAGPRPVSSQPSGWQRQPAATYLRRRAGAAIARGRELLLIHRDSAREEAHGTGAPRTMLKGGSWMSSPRGLRSPAQRLDMKGPHRRAHMGWRSRGQGPGRGRGRGRGQGISPLNRPQLTKEQLDQELDAYMAPYKAKECLDADLEAYMAQPVPDQEGLDDDLDAIMADADPETPTENDS